MVKAADVVKSAYKAFDRRGIGRVSAKVYRAYTWSGFFLAKLSCPPPRRLVDGVIRLLVGLLAYCGAGAATTRLAPDPEESDKRLPR